ncbi:MAG: hypothetical protein WC247_12170 [Porticoccaceae bacterium]
MNGEGVAPKAPSADVGGDPVAGGDELKAWLEWLEQAVAAGGTLSRLAALELRLAVASSGRLLVLALVILPLVVFAWLGLSVLLGWLAFQYSLSVSVGLGTFLGVQLAALAALGWGCLRYRRRLSLPATRRHLQAFREGLQRGAQTTDR